MEKMERRMPKALQILPYKDVEPEMDDEVENSWRMGYMADMGTSMKGQLTFPESTESGLGL